MSNILNDYEASQRRLRELAYGPSGEPPAEETPSQSLGSRITSKLKSWIFSSSPKKDAPKPETPAYQPTYQLDLFDDEEEAQLEEPVKAEPEQTAQILVGDKIPLIKAEDVPTAPADAERKGNDWIGLPENGEIQPPQPLAPKVGHRAPEKFVNLRKNSSVFPKQAPQPPESSKSERPAAKASVHLSDNLAPSDSTIPQRPDEAVDSDLQPDGTQSFIKFPDKFVNLRKNSSVFPGKTSQRPDEAPDSISQADETQSSLGDYDDIDEKPLKRPPFNPGFYTRLNASMEELSPSRETGKEYSGFDSDNVAPEVVVAAAAPNDAPALPKPKPIQEDPGMLRRAFSSVKTALFGRPKLAPWSGVPKDPSKISFDPNQGFELQPIRPRPAPAAAAPAPAPLPAVPAFPQQYANNSSQLSADSTEMRSLNHSRAKQPPRAAISPTASMGVPSLHHAPLPQPQGSSSPSASASPRQFSPQTASSPHHLPGSFVPIGATPAPRPQPHLPPIGASSYSPNHMSDADPASPPVVPIDTAKQISSPSSSPEPDAGLAVTLQPAANPPVSLPTRRIHDHPVFWGGRKYLLTVDNVPDTGPQLTNAHVAAMFQTALSEMPSTPVYKSGMPELSLTFDQTDTVTATIPKSTKPIPPHQFKSSNPNISFQTYSNALCHGDATSIQGLVNLPSSTRTSSGSNPPAPPAPAPQNTPSAQSPQSAPVASPKPLPLPNGGNTCPVASAVQMIMSEPKLRTGMQGNTRSVGLSSFIENYEKNQRLHSQAPLQVGKWFDPILGSANEEMKLKNKQPRKTHDVAEVIETLYSTVPALQVAKTLDGQIQEEGAPLIRLAPNATTSDLSKLLDASNETHLFAPPPTIWLHIDRTRNKTPILVTDEKITIPEKYIEGGPHDYSLKGFSVHKSGNHYISYTKTFDPQRTPHYWECNDSTVTEIDKQLFLHEAANATLHCLDNEKIELPDPSQNLSPLAPTPPPSSANEVLAAKKYSIRNGTTELVLERGDIATQQVEAVVAPFSTTGDGTLVPVGQSRNLYSVAGRTYINAEISRVKNELKRSQFRIKEVILTGSGALRDKKHRQHILHAYFPKVRAGLLTTEDQNNFKETAREVLRIAKNRNIRSLAFSNEFNYPRATAVKDLWSVMKEEEFKDQFTQVKLLVREEPGTFDFTEAYQAVQPSTP